MTIRAVLIGLLLGTFLASVGWFNDWVLQQGFLASDMLPVSVYGLLVVVLLLVRPLLWPVRWLRFRASEYCVIVVLMAVACVIPGPGLMWNFSNTVAMPQHYNTILPGWQRTDPLSYVPKSIVVDASQDPNAVSDFIAGRSADSPAEAFHNVPWAAWTPTLSFWMPLLALGFVGGVCMMLVVHRQWSDREHLRYPIADFASSLLDGVDGKRFPSVFRDRFFWMGFAIVAVFLLVNGISEWTDRMFPRFPMALDLSGVVKLYPKIWTAPGSMSLIYPRLYFAAVGFAFFVSRDVSFSLGISHIAQAAVFLILTTAGFKMSSDYLAGGTMPFLWFGAYFGVALMLLYLGRAYYRSVLARGLGLGRRDASIETTVRPAAVWGFRLGLACAAGVVLLLVFKTQLDWRLAVLFVLLMGMLFLVLARVSVETGLFFVQPGWHAVTILLALFGAKALGPNMLIILGIVSIVLTVDPRVAVTPLVANALKLGQSTKLKPGRLASGMGVSLLLALGIGMTVTLCFQYVYGGGTLYGWANEAAQLPFDLLLRELPNMELDGSGWQSFRIGDISPVSGFLPAAGIGLGLVLLCSALRLRLSWWPLHPVFFLVWGTYPANQMAASFLLGWAIKSAIQHLGGGKAVARAKPLFVGLVAGELAMGLFWMLWSLGYYLCHGVNGPVFRFRL